MSHYVFVESNTTGTGRLAVERLIDEGAEVSFVTSARARYPFLAREAANLRVVACETNDEAAVEACLRALPAIDAVLTFSTFYVTTVAAVARRLGLPALDPEAARTCHHKQRTRQCFARAGVPTPAFWLVASAAEAQAAAAEVSYPCVIKPVAESGSAGVLRVDTPAALLAHHRDLAARTVNERGQRVFGEVLIEGLLEGPEYSVETLTAGGTTHVVGVTEKRLSAPPYFVELGHEFPAALGDADRDAIEHAVRTGLATVGVDFGPAHTELRLTARGPVIIEINPRLAGGMIPELVRWATGLDLLGAILALARGAPPALDVTRHDVAGIRFVTAPRAGALREVRGLAAARDLPSVREVRIDKPAGAQVRPATCATDRLGHVIAAGPDRAAVRHDLDAALARVVVEVDA
jgi:biotin carboxylase